MTSKFDEFCTWTDDSSSLEELDAEHFGRSVRERIDGAVRAKANRRLPARHFYQIIEETADDFLAEGQAHPENQRRFDEIKAAYYELLPAFRVLVDHMKDNRVLDGAVRDVMWSAFLIGLACDRERLENPEILERYSSAVAGKARDRRKEKQDEWGERVYRAVCAAIPVALKAQGKFRKATKTTKAAENLLPYVVDEMAKTDLNKKDVEERLKPNAVRKALSRCIDEKKMDVSSRDIQPPDAS